MRYSIDPTAFLPQLIEDLKDTSTPLKAIAKKHGVSYGWVWSFIKKNHIKVKRTRGIKPITQEQVDLIIDLTAKGYTGTEIAQKAGLAKATISRYRKLNGLCKTYKPRTPDAVVRTHPGKELLALPCKRATHTAVRNAAGFFEVPVEDFLAEAVAHYIKHLKS